MTCQTHCLLPHIRTAGSVVPCFDLPLSQRTVGSPSLVWVNVESLYSTASSSSRIYIFYLHMAHTLVSTTVVYCLQSKLPTHQSANIRVHCTPNERTVAIQLCQYRYPSSNNDWLVHNDLEWTRKEVVATCLKYYCNICFKGHRRANKNLSG